MFPSKPILRTACILLLASAPIAVRADGSFYLKAFGGASDLRGDSLSLGGTTSAVDYDTGVIFGGAFGYDYADSPWSTEIEFAYRSADATPAAALGTGGDFASTALMVNGFYSFSTPGPFVPYVGLGIGVATEIDFDIDTGPAAGEYNDTGVFAAQIMVGANYAVSDRVTLSGELRYFTAGSQSLQGPGGAVIEADYDSIDALLGLSIRF